MRKIMRIALKVAYIGSQFHGLKIQPDVNTIEHELFSALEQMGIIADVESANYAAAGRTDTGVHSMGQVIAFDTDRPDIAIPRAINEKLPPSIRMWSRAEVPDDFDPERDALHRTYRYVLTGEQYDISRIRNAAKVFLGTHDFFNFTPSQTADTASDMRNIENIDVRIDGNYTIIDITANSFLWNMVRRMIAALAMVGCGDRDEEWLKDMLNPEMFEEGMGQFSVNAAPACGLVLADVDYGKTVKWVDDEYSKRKAVEYLHKHYLKFNTMAEVFRFMASSMKPQLISDSIEP